MEHTEDATPGEVRSSEGLGRTAAYAPGPWKVANPIDPHWSRGVSSKNGHSDVAFCGSFPLELAQANARLIAAAPDLLAALVKVRDELAGLPRSLGYDFTHLPEIDAAIAKALGLVSP